MIPRVLTIGGSDSSGAVGIQADLKTFEARQVYGLSALTLVTAQNSSGIQSVKLLEPDFVLAQIEAVAESQASAIKTGLLLNADMIRAVHRGIADRHHDEAGTGPAAVDSGRATRLASGDREPHRARTG